MSDNGIKYMIGLKSENTTYKNNFIPSTLHCLINLNILSDFIKNSEKIEPEKNPLFAKYKELLQNLENLKKEDTKLLYEIKDFEKVLFENNKFQLKDNQNPIYLLHHLITEFNLFLVTEYKNTLISDQCFTIIETVKKCPKCDNFVEDEIKMEEKYLNYDLCQYINKNEEYNYNIYDCLKSYVKIEENQINIYCKYCKKNIVPKTKILFKKLPNYLFIYVDYGDDINFKLDDNKNITFDKKLDFSKIKEVEKNYQNWKYYLSSLISVKEIMTKNEYFYTFCIHKEKDIQKYKYFCFNADTVHEVKSIDNKTDNKIIDLNNKKERFPLILIYTSLNE